MGNAYRKRSPAGSPWPWGRSGKPRAGRSRGGGGTRRRLDPWPWGLYGAVAEPGEQTGSEDGDRDGSHCVAAGSWSIAALCSGGAVQKTGEAEGAQLLDPREGPV